MYVYYRVYSKSHMRLSNSLYLDFDHQILYCLLHGCHPSKEKENKEIVSIENAYLLVSVQGKRLRTVNYSTSRLRGILIRPSSVCLGS